ncbi:MAG: IS66 family insertion sequence element accessory protein TnpB [Oligoflexales bacterium]
MKNCGDFQNIYLYRPYVDMRRQSSGLAEIVAEFEVGDPLSGDLFLFRSRRRNLIKAIYWDKNGFAMWTKRLSADTFPWPKSLDLDTVTLNVEQLRWLLDGVDYWKIKRYKDLDFKKIL